MTNKSRFTNRVDDYVKYRPGYPDALVQFLQQRLCIDSQTIIADIGSGTGISAKLWLDLGAKVFAVEPNENMRRAAERDLALYPKFISINGSAEQTALEDKSVDAIVCAQAFHWFCNADTKVEFQRIIKPNGHIALIWNDRDEADALQAAYEKIIQKYSSDYNQIAHKNITDDIIRQFFNSKIEKHLFTYEQQFDFEGLLGRITSSSYMPTQSDPKFEPMKNEVEILFNQFKEADVVKYKYVTRVFVVDATKPE
jgi:ubiquinone/menaquinone biosynthesis C-methylase UbiE